jgi:hypothetical protein
VKKVVKSVTHPAPKIQDDEDKDDEDDEEDVKPQNGKVTARDSEEDSEEDEKPQVSSVQP